MLDRRQLIILASDHSSSSIVLHECETAHHSNRESTTAAGTRREAVGGVHSHSRIHRPNEGLLQPRKRVAGVGRVHHAQLHFVPVAKPQVQ